MKAILKGVRQDCNLDYEDTFNSSKNLEIRGQLIEELRKAMAPKFRPSVNQLTKWLSSIHKSRRSQKKLKLTGKIADDYRRIHSNSRLNDVCNSLNN
jgi:hypothetical protein